MKTELLSGFRFSIRSYCLPSVPFAVFHPNNARADSKTYQEVRKFRYFVRFGLSPMLMYISR